MDVHTPEQRSFNMSRIKGKNTKPEMLVRKWLWHQGYRYQLHRKDLPCKPDIVFPRRKKIIFIHGCFWHQHDCKYFKWPKNNQQFWRKKIGNNVIRDQKNAQLLKEKGWKILTVWECEIKNDQNNILNSIISFLSHTYENAKVPELCVAERDILYNTTNFYVL